MNSLLEIFKYTIPSLVVFGTAYYLLKMYLNTELRTREMELNKDLLSSRLPLKLQAYERLLLFCERIKLSNLVMRLRTSNMRNEELLNVILISVQKEFEHNLAQQLYTSSNLWEILKLAKDEILNQSVQAMEGLSADENASTLGNKLIELERNWSNDPVEQAKKAIKEEARILLA